MTEIKTVEQLGSAFSEFKSNFDSKQDALTKQVQTKIGEAMTKFIETKQQDELKIKAVEEKAALLETAINRISTKSADEAEDVKKELNLAVKSWIKDGANTELNEYMKAQKFESKAMREAVDPDGGYLIRSDFGGIIDTRVFDTSPMRALATVLPINSNAFEFVADEDEAAVSSTTEEGTRSSTATPQVKLRRIPVYEVYANAPVTQTLLQDFPGIDSWLANKIGDKIGRAENVNFVTGDGVNKARGFATYSAWAAAGTFEAGKVEQVNSGSAAALTYTGILSLMGALNEEYQAAARFTCKRQTFYTDIMALKDSQNMPIFSLAWDNKTPSLNLLGKPVTFFNDMAATAANALNLAYGDFGRGYFIVDRLGVNLIRDPYSSKPNILFYATKRSGGDVANFQAIKIQKCST